MCICCSFFPFLFGIWIGAVSGKLVLCFLILIQLCASRNRYDVIDILLDDIDQFKKPFDFQLYFKLFHKLDKSIVVQDVFEANSSSRHRSYSIHTQGLWNKIDPIINEAIQNNTAAFNIDEGYKYITFLSREECSEVHQFGTSNLQHVY